MEPTEIVELFGVLHAEVARAVVELDEVGCNWAPAEGANSVATLVVHLLGSEAEAFHLALGRPDDRDRPGEFVPGVRTRRELLERLAAADRRLHDEWAPALCADAHPLRRLVANHGHAREHLGQLLLTAQLYREARERSGTLRPFAGAP